jgi:four helix bundle protein
MKIEKFEDIIAWQKSQDFAVEIYTVFSKIKDFGFKDQICRAVISISNNIAEGFDRSSNAEFLKFLYYSLASCSEVQSMLYLSDRFGFTTIQQKTDLLLKSKELSRIIKGLINSLKKYENK